MTWPAPTTRKQIREHLIREQLCPMSRQKRKHTARLEKMPRYRFRIQQFALTLRSPLHPKIIANNHSQQGDRHAG